MAEVAHIFICDRAYEDDRGQPCVIGMFDHIQSAAFPLSHPRMVVAVQLVGHHDEGCDVTVDVLDPRHHVLLSTHNDAPASLSEIGQGFVFLTLTDTAFEEPGRYTVRVFFEGRVVASKPLFLQQTGSVQDPRGSTSRHFSPTRRRRLTGAPGWWNQGFSTKRAPLSAFGTA